MCKCAIDALIERDYDVIEKEKAYLGRLILAAHVTKIDAETVPNQKNKPTEKPTLRWVFFLCREIQSCMVNLNDCVYASILNMDNERIKILRLLGPDYEKFYS
jgi:hypothetical protein